MQTCVSRELRKEVDKLVESGEWELSGGKKHPRMIHKPSGRKVTLSSSASDHRAVLNFRSDCRKVSRGVYA